MASDTQTRTICAVLRGESATWGGGDDADAIRTFLDACRYHGVLSLLDWKLGSEPLSAGAGAPADNGSDPNFWPPNFWPREIRVACAKATLQQAMYELAHRAEMTRVLAALSAAGIAPLVLKGTALAYSHYANPALRTRSDTDLLIPAGARAEAEQALQQLGYAKSEGVEGEFVSTQATWSRTDRLGATHHLDVHWQINNSRVLARTLDYPELSARAVPLPALGPDARALAAVDALLFACIHRAGHANAPYYVDGGIHAGDDRLIWLYDIHLLIAGMSASELDEFAALATAKQIKAICRDALVCTAECFATPIPERILEILRVVGPAEPSAHFLVGGRLRQMVGDFRAYERWSDRVQWLGELAFPSAGYMRSKYPDAALTWLPILYVRRGLTGVARLLFRQGSGHGH